MAGTLSTIPSLSDAWRRRWRPAFGALSGTGTGPTKFICIYTGTYTAQLKVFRQNTLDWLDVELKKSDVDYIFRRCKTRKECVPTLRKRGKEWFLDFAFEEKVSLRNPDIHDRVIVAVALGLNNACTCCVMTAEGTILDRKLLSLPETARLEAAAKVPQLSRRTTCTFSDLLSLNAVLAA